MVAGLEIKNLTKKFGEGKEAVTAVNDISFSIKEGELFSLLGESGCGKTTTLRMIAGLEQVTDGQILFFGDNFTHVPPNKRGIGMVFQSYALYPHMSIFENVAYALRIRRLPKNEIKKKVDEALTIVDLPPGTYSGRRPSELSGGQQQRIALARALVYDPKLLLFDEPLSNLDAKLRVYMRDEIRKIQQRAGITAVYVTHDQEEALAISDRVAIMFNGEIEQVGTPVEVYEKPKTMHVADFIGKANLIPAPVDKMENSRGIARFPSGEVIEGYVNADPNEIGEMATIMIRPERIRIEKAVTDAAEKSAKNSLKATVKNITYLGNRTRYELLTKFEEKLTCDTIRMVEGIETGNEVFLSVNPDDALFLPASSKKPRAPETDESKTK